MKEQKNNLKKAFNWILNLLLIILLIIGIYMFYDKIFRGSPTDFQFILWIAGFFGAAIFKIFNLIYGINREIGELKIGELKIGVKSGFNKIKNDISNINNNLQDIKKSI